MSQRESNQGCPAKKNVTRDRANIPQVRPPGEGEVEHVPAESPLHAPALLVWSHQGDFKSFLQLQNCKYQRCNMKETHLEREITAF